MTRASSKTIATVERIVVGDIDPMSVTARRFAVPLCGVVSAEQSDYRCTRAAGHHEAFKGHPGTEHVATGAIFVAVAVWS